MATNNTITVWTGRHSYAELREQAELTVASCNAAAHDLERLIGLAGWYVQSKKWSKATADHEAFDSKQDFLAWFCGEHLSGLRAEARNMVIRFMAAHGVDAGPIGRAMKVSTATASRVGRGLQGNGGHGGARNQVSPVAKLAEGLAKVQADKLTKEDLAALRKMQKQIAKLIG